MVFFKNHSISLSDQLELLARLALTFQSRDDDSDLEAQVSRNLVDSSIKTRSLQRYGATDNFLTLSLRPLLSHRPRSEESTELGSLHSEEVRSRSPQPLFQLLAPLPRPLVFGLVLLTAGFLWNRIHLAERRQLGVWHKCAGFAFLVLAAGGVFLVATGRQNEAKDLARRFICWFQEQLAWGSLPFCEADF